RREGRAGPRFDGERRGIGAERARFRGQGLSIRIAKGRNDQEWSVGRILGALCAALGVSRDEIGNIKMRDSHTEVELSPAAIASLDDGGRRRLIDRGLISGASGEPRLGGARRERRFDRSGERLGKRNFERTSERRPRYGRDA
ncbi:DbpA RNA binding domain protein, partial [Pyramidobacter piscolens W5455]